MFDEPDGPFAWAIILTIASMIGVVVLIAVIAF